MACSIQISTVMGWTEGAEVHLRVQGAVIGEAAAELDKVDKIEIHVYKCMLGAVYVDKEDPEFTRVNQTYISF